MKVLRIVFLVLCAMNLNAQQIRNVKTINAGWKFLKNEQKDISFVSKEKEGWQQVNLPHCFNAEDGEDEKYGYYRGNTWYVKEINVDSTYRNKQLFLYFEGANQVSELFVNGQQVGKHIGGYGSFCFDITPFINTNSKNTLAVRVDNSFQQDIAPLDADFSFFGGIYRDVRLVATNTLHFDMLNNGSSGVFIDTPKVSEQLAFCDIRVSVKNDSKSKQNFALRTRILDVSGALIASRISKVSGAANSLTAIEQKEIKITAPQLWSPDSPYLYTVITEICDSKGNVIDVVTNSLGLRWYTFDATKGFILNGKPLKLIGVNRHQYYTKQGFALSDEQHTYDIQLLKEMGGNCLRIAHYQQDPAILEACDRMGIVATVEIPIVNYITENSTDFRNNCLNMAVEMVRRDYNHPSVFVWAYMNEILNNNKPKKPENMKRLNQLAIAIDSLIHVEDKNRFTMVPNAEWFEGYKEAGLIDLPQICGWNIYEGWYGEKLSDFEQYMDNFHKQYPNKPTMITEYGAGADPRIRSFAPERFDFSMEYQNKYHEHYIKAIMERPYIAGAFVWNFIDFLAEPRQDATPHVNNKGLATLDRKLKDSYYLYQAHLLKTPFVAIASKGWNAREGLSVKYEENFCTQLLTIYSNQKEVELFLNHQSLGKKAVSDCKVEWDVPFVNGTNLLEAVCVWDGKITKDMAEIDFTLWDFPLNKNPASFPAIHVNTGSNYSFYDEKNHCTWLADQDYTVGSWGHIGGKRYRAGDRPASQREITNTSDEPLYQTQMIDPQWYRFDVPDGVYEVSLLFAELLSEKQMQKSLYNLNADAIAEKAVKRVFDVDINKTNFLKNFNIKEEYGEVTAVPVKCMIDVRDGKGIEIKFTALAGASVVNGISVVRVK